MLNLQSLKYFCDAVRYGSISQSAKKNFVSQSAISQAIAKLEAHLKIALTTHAPNRFKPSPEGLLLFEKSKRIFDATQDLEQTFQNQEGKHVGQLTFACMHSFALALLPYYLGTFREKFPHLQVNFRLGHTDIIKDLLKQGLIDVGIVLDNDDLSAFEQVEIYKGNYRAYCTKNSSDSLPFLLTEERIETNLFKDAYKKRYKKEVEVLMEVYSWEVIARLTEEGLGIGFFPDYVALKREKKLCEYPLDIEPIPYRILAIYPKAKKLHQNLSVFLDHFLN